MFKINRRTDYTVRVMLSLARRKAGSRLPTQVVQSEMQIPSPFLRRIIADLRREGLIRTFMGANGGVELALPSEEIQLRQIWEASEGPIQISDCLKGEHACPLESGCPVNRRWKRLQNLIIQELESINLADLADEAGRLPAEISIGVMTQSLLAPFATD